MKKNVLAAVLSGLIATLAVGSLAHAAWPDRPVTIIVPAGAGGGTGDGLYAAVAIHAGDLEDEFLSHVI